MADPSESWVKDLFSAAGRSLSPVVFAGFIAGGLIGGIGSRLAMLILRLTSGPGLHGLETDDGFIIGQISTDSFFLLALGIVSGLMGAIAYSIGRLWVPERLRAPVTAVVFGIVGGSLIVRPEGIDFRLLQPLWLAIALFVVVPAAEGWLISVLVEKFLREESGFKRGPMWLALLPLTTLALGGPVSLVFVVLSAVLWSIVRAQPTLGAAWRSEAVTWLGRAALAVLVAFASVALVRDAIAILG